MRALRKLTAGFGYPELCEVPIPEPSPGQVRLAVTASGVCGTDLHIVHGDYSSSPPVTMGHEIAGIVDSVGPGVEETLIGRLAAPRTVFSACGRCQSCLSGRPMLCPERVSIGSGTDGGFATHVVVPATAVHALPPSLSPLLAALTEPLACVCNALFNPTVVQAGQHVLVTGAGAIGLLAAQVARACGATVTVAGKSDDEDRFAIAERLGFGVRCVDDPVDAAALEDWGRQRRFDVVVECAGSPSAASLALRLVRPGGTHVQMGLMAGEVAVPFGRIVEAEIKVVSGFASSPVSWLAALELLEGPHLDLEPLVTGVFRLEDWRSAFDQAERRVGVKNLIVP